jgi:hypothetical protein
MTHMCNGRSVTFKDWVLTVDGKPIDIPHVKSDIDIRHSGDRMTVLVNGKTVYEDPAAR